MFTLLALSTLALADQALEQAPEPCNGTEVDYLLPAHGSADLPHAVQPYLRFGGNCMDWVRVQLLDGEQRVVFEASHDPFASLDLDLPLLDLESGTYLLSVRGVDGELLDRSEFVVTGSDPEALEAPTIEVEATTYDDSWVDLVATFGNLPEQGIVAVQVNGQDAGRTPVTGTFWFSYDGVDATVEQCYSARVRGVSGEWSAPGEVCVVPTLVEYDDLAWCGNACSNLGKIPAGGGFLLASLAGLFARRRIS